MPHACRILLRMDHYPCSASPLLSIRTAALCMLRAGALLKMMGARHFCCYIYIYYAYASLAPICYLLLLLLLLWLCCTRICLLSILLACYRYRSHIATSPAYARDRKYIIHNTINTYNT
jgi:hypothetical protein